MLLPRLHFSTFSKPHIRPFFMLLLIFSLTTGATCRSKTTASTNCFKGKLVIKGICMNYVIQLTEGNASALNIEKTWTDENDGKVYRNVFALGNKCNFTNVKEGEEFYFTLAAKTEEDCMQCQAFRPVPPARNNITVSKTPCR